MFSKIIIIALLSLILTGCGNNDVAKNNTDDYTRLNNNSDYPLTENQIYNNSNDKYTIPYEKEKLEPNNENSTEKTERNIHQIEEDFYGNIPLITEKALHTFTTPILTSDPNRYHNITLVRDRLDGYILGNNETFSFNEVCGPYGKDDGFKEAKILLSNGKTDIGYGGGVCQLSSTLYNAVKDLDVDITERHNHSTPVKYVPENEDATVSLQSDLDFKFKNVSGKDLRFESTSTEDSLTVTVYEVE